MNIDTETKALLQELLETVDELTFHYGGFHSELATARVLQDKPDARGHMLAALFPLSPRNEAYVDQVKPRSTDRDALVAVAEALAKATEALQAAIG